MIVKSWVGICFVLLLVACGQVSGETKNNVQNEEEDSSTGSSDRSFLTFSWIEQGYDGVFAPVQLDLGQSSEEISATFGPPLDQGSYEGGNYWNYGDLTLFINPMTDRSVAIALNIEDRQLTEEDLKRELGTPDRSELNNMDGYWMFVYELDQYELMFEAKSESETILYGWLIQKM